MSKVAPHNAVVKYLVQDHEQIVLKQYRVGAKYTAEQEGQAYKKLSKLLKKVVGVRVANVISIEMKDNALYLEFIPGESLHERINAGDQEILGSLMRSLVDLFWVARQESLQFDSDPSNIMFDQNGMVLIDPVCTELAIEDYSFIVFMWGLVKIILRNRRVWKSINVVSHWKLYYRAYCKRSGVTYNILNRQMVSYIDLVIKWNREKNKVEGVVLRLFRYIIVVQVYKLVRLLFQFNLVKY